LLLQGRVGDGRATCRRGTDATGGDEGYLLDYGGRALGPCFWFAGHSRYSPRLRGCPGAEPSRERVLRVTQLHQPIRHPPSHPDRGEAGDARATNREIRRDARARREDLLKKRTASIHPWPPAA